MILFDGGARTLLVVAAVVLDPDERFTMNRSSRISRDWSNAKLN